MRIELVRMTAAWLMDPTYGVNAKIPGVERDAGDAVPPDIAAWTPEAGPATIAVFNEEDHEWVVDKKAPPASPALYVMGEGEIEMIGEVMTIQRRTTRDVPILIRYITDRSDKVVAKRDGEYTGRAIVRSLRELMRNGNFAARTRNNVCIEFMGSVSYVPMVEAVGSCRSMGAVVAFYRAIDAAP
ncbi:MAG TPA: hypothetical protein VK573_12805 [Gemmatimonadales bacterium]|nr:hypothetical protein [Gemmatimonadales bacterium]